MIFSPVEPFHHLGFRITYKPMPVKIAYKIHSTTASINKSRIDIYNHHPFHLRPVTIYRQLNEIRTFELIGLRTKSFSKIHSCIPTASSLQMNKTHILVRTDNHNPFCPGSYQRPSGSRKFCGPSNGVRTGFVHILYKYVHCPCCMPYFAPDSVHRVHYGAKYKKQ